MMLCADIMHDVLQFLNISECKNILFASKCVTTPALRRIDVLVNSLNLDVECNRLTDFILDASDNPNFTESEIASIEILIHKVSHFVSSNLLIASKDISVAVMCNIMKENTKVADKIRLFFGIRKEIDSGVVMDAFGAALDLSVLPNAKAKHLWIISRILDRVFAERGK